jgi:cytidylate kinase
MVNSLQKEKQNIITVDGPSGSGKGTVSQLLADKLGWRMLDSGALYRVLGLATQRHSLSFSDEEKITELARNLDIQFNINKETGEVEPIFENENISSLIRTDEAGQAASKVAAISTVRDALLARQQDFYQPPGLVADGRDMGTVVFPQAPVKIFLTASAECRAERRFNQLKNKGVDANMRALLDSIKARDERDSNRSVAPLVPASDALIIDSSEMSIDEVLSQVIDFADKKVSDLKSS